MNVLRFLFVLVGEAYFNILIYSFFHSNAENNIMHTFYEELRSGSVLKVS